MGIHREKLKDCRDEIISLYKQAYQKRPQYSEEDISGYFDWIEERTPRDIWVARQEDKAVGFLADSLKSYILPDSAEMIELAVLPVNQRKKIATALIEKSLDYLKSRGSHRVAVEVGESNIESLALCRKYGFRPLHKNNKWLELYKEL